MPEHAELRLTAAYINGAAEGRHFTRIDKNPGHKGLPISTPFTPFTIAATSRGKELMVRLTSASGQVMNILMGMGMSGCFEWAPTGTPLPKHTHLWFEGEKGTLCFVDVRRFGKWKISDGWSPNRGPDPVREYDNFVKHVKWVALGKKGGVPIHLALMDQSIFSGIGNYLRAEILYRIPKLSPFAPLREAVEHPSLFTLCHDIPSIAYQLGGGQLRDWKSPTGEDPRHFGEFIKCYGKTISFRDKGGRTFWMHPKWVPAAKLYLSIKEQ
jgi:endonuclease VIII-like 1